MKLHGTPFDLPRGDDMVARPPPNKKKERNEMKWNGMKCNATKEIMNERMNEVPIQLSE